jgi:hypothetical protein
LYFAYGAPRLGYLLLWGGAVLLLSSTLALVLGMRPGWVSGLSTRFAPAIVDVSGWYHVFEEGPPNAFVYVGCDLRDGSYVGGTLDWYSTAVEETADRDFVLAGPITFRPPGEPEDPLLGVSRIVISARDVARLYVSYIDGSTAPAPDASPPVDEA